MTDWILGHESAIRLGAFAGVFAAMALWEFLAARRHLRALKGRRWLANLSLVAVDTIVLRLAFPVAALGMAAVAAGWGWGVLNNVAVPYAAAVGAGVVLLDLGVYLQHVMFHAIPLLWRFHMVHHADVDFDVTTGIRFHPVEMVLSMGIKLALVVLLGPPVVAVLVFEVVLNAAAMFNHANVRLPGWLDRPLRWLIVTPDMHRVHHSVQPVEYNSNFGFNLPWWDRMLGTYRDQPVDGHERMAIGLGSLQSALSQPLHWLIALPFTKLPSRRDETPT